MRVRCVYVYVGDCEQNRTKRNRMRNGTAANATERSASWLRQGRSMFIGASSSLKSLCCLRDGVWPSPLPPPVGGTRTESPWHRLYGKGAREGAVGREARRARTRGEIYLLGGVLRSRNRVKGVGQTDDRGAHPPHYAHRSRDFNVPLEMVALRGTRHLFRCWERIDGNY